MNGTDIFFLVFAVLGGLALFIFGMSIMTEGLRFAAGERLRSILSRAGRRRLAGLAIGTGLGALVHSSAATVMLVGFVSAGLMTLAETVPVILGANIGTTISMQAVSLKLGAYCYVAITLGLVFTLAGRTTRAKQFGRAILGFGLLFLGMNTMSDAIRPHKAALAPFLAQIDGSTLPGVLAGIGMSTALTAIWQSSGATVGLCFALTTAGVFTRMEQILPVVLGAHIGTCATALLGSVGTHIEARRCAVAHLVFNLFNVSLAVACREYLYRLLPLTGTDLVRQTANLHTIVMVGGALPLLPLTGLYARFIRLVAYSRKPLPEKSFLDPELLKTPEHALAASMRELQRVSAVCGRSLRLVANVMLFDYKRGTVQAIRHNETIIDEIKTAVRSYLSHMASRYLSRRQSVLLQYVDRCITELERIGDHIESVSSLSLLREKDRQALFHRELLEKLFAMYQAARAVLAAVTDSLDVDREQFAEGAARILDARSRYVELSIEAKAVFAECAAKHSMPAISGVYLAEYTAAFDRLVDHARNIAFIERNPDFRIKHSKLERVAEPPPPSPPTEVVDPKEFLDRLGE